MIEISSPKYPLDLAVFNRALCTGHGRALKHVQVYGSADIKDSIVDATVNCRVFDPQCEPDRVDWLVEMIQISDLTGRVLDAIAKSSVSPDSDSFYDIDQQCAVLEKFAKQGFLNARSLIYSMFQRVEGSDSIVGLESIVNLDGAEGLLFVSQKMGQWLAEDPEFWVDNQAVLLFDNQFGGGKAQEILEEAALTDPDIARYLKALNSNIDSNSPKGYLKVPFGFGPENVVQSHWEKLRQYSVESIIELVRSDPEEIFPPLPLTGWGRIASNDDLEKLFRTMLKETNIIRISRFLSCFTLVAPPHFDAKMLEWLDVEEENLHNRTVRALSHLKDERIRQIALDRLANGKLDDGARLLQSNYRTSDHTLIEKILVPFPDENELHWTIQNILELFKKNISAEAIASLVFAYEYSPCMNCRLHSLELLQELASTPEWILEECRLDGDILIRNLFIGKKAL